MGDVFSQQVKKREEVAGDSGLGVRSGIPAPKTRKTQLRLWTAGWGRDILMQIEKQAVAPAVSDGKGNGVRSPASRSLWCPAREQVRPP